MPRETRQLYLQEQVLPDILKRKEGSSWTNTELHKVIQKIASIQDKVPIAGNLLNNLLQNYEDVAQNYLDKRASVQKELTEKHKYMVESIASNISGTEKETKELTDISQYTPEFYMKYVYWPKGNVRLNLDQPVLEDKLDALREACGVQKAFHDGKTEETDNLYIPLQKIKSGTIYNVKTKSGTVKARETRVIYQAADNDFLRYSEIESGLARQVTAIELDYSMSLSNRNVLAAYITHRLAPAKK